MEAVHRARIGRLFVMLHVGNKKSFNRKSDLASWLLGFQSSSDTCFIDVGDISCLNHIGQVLRPP